MNSVTVNVVAREVSGDATIKILAEKGTSGSSDRDESANKNLTTSYATYSNTWNTNPFVGGAWTAAQVNTWAMKFGVTKSNSTTEARVTHLEVVVDYTIQTCNSLVATITGNGTINGTAGDDIIVGSSGVDTINGNGGNDTICALGGNDDVTTGNGNDWIDGGAGGDDISAGAGNNTILGGDDNDDIVTGNGNDTIDAGNGSNTVQAGAGTNIVTGGNGNDNITTGNDSDTINAGDGSNTVNAGAGVNSVTGGNGNDDVTTGNDNDTINVGDGSNTVNAGAGTNSVIGGNGNDNVTTGNNDDTINVGDGSNTVNAGAGTNSITGGNGNDTVTTGNGADTIDVGDGSNNVQSGGGNDYISGGSGNDTFDGGADYDICIVFGGSNSVTNCESNGSSATIIVNRVITNDDGGTLVAGGVTLLIDGNTVTSGASNSVSAGAHTVSANAVANYTQTITGDCNGAGSVTVASGETKTCTVTYNDIAPTLTVTKVVVNQYGSSKVVADFPLFVNGNSVTSGNANSLAVGSYVVTETGDSDFDAVFSGACDANGNVSLAFGDAKTCTITNTAKGVEICHAPPGNPENTSTQTVLPSQVQDHLDNHEGDYEGACAGDVEGDEPVRICHKPDGPNPQTMMVDPDDVSGHLGHGDELGYCEGDMTPMTLGYETIETGTAPGIGSCPVTTADMTANGGTAAREYLEWTYVPTAHHYDVYGYTWNGSSWNGGVPYALLNVAGSDQEIDVANSTFIYKAFATNEGTYAYQIKAIDEEGNVMGETEAVVDETFTCTFTVDRSSVDTIAPAVPTHVSPADGAVLEVLGNLDWTDVTDPSSPVTYEYESSLSPTTGGPNGAFTAVLYGPVSTGTNSFIDASGTSDGTYYWHVRAKDDAGNYSNWSAPWSITRDSTPPEACVVTDDYLVAHWQLDEASEATTAADATGNGNNGTVNGASSDGGPATGVSFANEGSYSFDGSNDAVSVSSANLDFATTDAFSVSAWVKPDAFSGYQTVVHKIDDAVEARNGYLLTLNNGVPEVWLINDYPEAHTVVSANAALTAGAWSQIAFSYDGSGDASGVRVYVNGTDVTGPTALADTLAGASIQNSAAFEIGFRSGAGAQAFDGLIDDVRVYEVALDGTQVSALAGGACNAGVVAPPPEEDSDGDGIPDDVDNCDFTNIPDQTDTDNDGLGDVCDEDEGGDGGQGGDGGESFGLSTPEANGDNGARRGKQTNILNSLIALFGGDGEPGDVPPGGFGGPGEEEFTDEETDVICRMRKALPEDASNAVREWVAQELAGKMPHSVEAIVEELKTGSICPQELVRTKAQAKPIAFRVDASGFPVSSNDTWNKCVRGTATLEDIRNNPDRDNDGYGISCSRYHTSSLWRHPDLGVYFTWKRQGKAISLPVGYAVKQDAVAQN